MSFQPPLAGFKIESALPYLEQGLAYSNVNLDESIISTQNKLALMAQPPVLLCPSDPHEGHNTITTANPALLSLGWTNYHSNAGSWSHINGWDGVFGPRLTEEERNSGGVGGGGELLPLKLSEITDGLSNTAAFTEVVNGLGYSRARAQKTDCFNLGSPLPSGTLSEVREVLLAKNWVTSSVYHDKVDLNVWRFRGYPFYEGTMWRNWYNHILPPNSPCWVPPSSNGTPSDQFWRIISPASSCHPDAVVMGLCDGSVRVISDHIDVDVWTAYGTRDGGETF